MISRSLAGLTLAMVAACAGATPPPSVHTTYEEVGASTVDLHPTDVAERTLVPGPPGVVYGALRAVYLQLGVVLAEDDSVHGEIGSRQARATRALNDKPMSTYFDCGLGQFGATADHSLILLRLVSRVQPAGRDSSAISTTVFARAQDMGTSTDPTLCASTGKLERLVANLTQLRLAP